MVGKKTTQFIEGNIFGGKKAAQRRLEYHNSENMDARIELKT